MDGLSLSPSCLRKNNFFAKKLAIQQIFLDFRFAMGQYLIIRSEAGKRRQAWQFAAMAANRTLADRNGRQNGPDRVGSANLLWKHDRVLRGCYRSH